MLSTGTSALNYNGTMSSNILEGLNKPQKEAVLHTAGPLLMLAGAGSGKTKALTHRIANLIHTHHIAPNQILAVTFTNKAAKEMRARVARLLSADASRYSFMPFMGTFHSICVKLLRRDGECIGIRKNFVIFDSSDSTSLIKTILKEQAVDAGEVTPARILNIISSAKNELMSPKNYAEMAHGKIQTIAANVYPRYQALLRQAGALDFDDLLSETVRLLAQPDMLETYQSQFKYILIDEYQDTNPAQYQMVKLLAATHNNICVVGDDWQSIYSWRGANFKNILDFERDYPKATIIKLEQNYRSTKAILAGAHGVITKNTVRSNKELWTEKTGENGIFLANVVDQIHEGNYIVREIERLTGSNTAGYQDFCVLYRTNAQSRSLEETFIRAGIPYKIVGGTRFYDRKEIKDVLAYLRLIHQPADVVSFNRVINVPNRGLGARSLEYTQQFQQEASMGLLQVLQSVQLVPNLTPKARAAFSGFAALLQDLIAEAKTKAVDELVELVVQRTNYLSYLDDGSVQAIDRQENVKELIGVAKTFSGVGLAEFLEEVALVSDIDSYNEAKQAVTLMTLHAAKGLEFDTVFMVGMEEGIFPHSRTSFDSSELEEERRLCYVGMTRAKERLYMLYADSRILYGQIMHNTPSRFLADIPESVRDKRSTAFGLLSGNATPQDSNNPWGAPELSAGEKVSHHQFGEGIVTEVDGDMVTVAFAGIGSKRLSLAFAPLEKVS